jgi:uncharacterized protein
MVSMNHVEKKLDFGRRAVPLAAELLEGQHKYELTEAEISRIFTRSIYQDVIHSAAFQRLKKIHFLGSLDYVIDPAGPKPNKRYTRFQHSLGVARLALQFARDRQLEEKDETIAVVSALLHDVGHAPLSHSLESVFKTEFGIGHHVISEKIVRGDVPIGASLNKVLRSSNVNPFEVLATMSGKGSGHLRELFNHAINSDTIEAIIRSSTYLYPQQLFQPPSDVLLALLTPSESSSSTLDSFWRLKDHVYNNLINSGTGLLADYVCQEYMRRHIQHFEEDHYYLTEPDLRDRHPQLFATLERLSVGAVLDLVPGSSEIKFVRRRFTIKTEVAFDHIFAVDQRYTQSRNEETYQLSRVGTGELDDQSARVKGSKGLF